MFSVPTSVHADHISSTVSKKQLRKHSGNLSHHVTEEITDEVAKTAAAQVWSSTLERREELSGRLQR